MLPRPRVYYEGVVCQGGVSGGRPRPLSRSHPCGAVWGVFGWIGGPSGQQTGIQRAEKAYRPRRATLDSGESEVTPEAGLEGVDVHVGEFPGLVRVVDRGVGGGRCPRRRGVPEPAVTQDLLDHLGLGRLDEGDEPSFRHHTENRPTGQSRRPA